LITLTKTLAGASQMKPDIVTEYNFVSIKPKSLRFLYSCIKSFRYSCTSEGLDWPQNTATIKGST